MIVQARIHVLECLRHLADLDFQWRVWVRGEGPELSSFTELVCQLFDDTTLGDELESGAARDTFGEAAHAKLVHLHDLIHQMPAGRDAASLLRHRRWQDVVEVAAEAAALVEEGERVRGHGDAE